MMYKAFSQRPPRRAAGRGSLKPGSLVEHEEKCWFGFRSPLGKGDNGLTAAEQMSPLFTHSRNGVQTRCGHGPVNQVGAEQQPGEGRRPTRLRDCVLRDCQHAMLPLMFPADRVSLSPDRPAPALPQCM